jgi:hypothetical protein
MSIRWRSRLAENYIKWANRLTFLRGDGVTTLRHIKERQDKDSHDTFLKTRPPEGATIELIYFRVFDIFQIENTDSLLSGLKKLFPGFSDPFFRGDYDEKFIQDATGISGGQWLNIGNICRDRRGRFFGDRFRELKTLPHYIDYIHIELHKVLPSIFVLTYDIHLEDSATKKLNELQNSLYKPETLFRRLIPYGKLGGGYSTNRAEHVMRRAIFDWLTNLRIQVEKCLEPFIVGDFLQDKSQKNSRLPSIEVYGIKGMPKTKTAIRNWIHTSRRWLESLGFHLLDINTFTDGKLIFVPRWQHDHDDNRPSYRLVVAWDLYLQSINCEIYGHDEKFAIAHETQESFLTPILPPLVIFEMLARFQGKFEKIRRNVLETIKPAIFHGTHFGKYINLSDTLLQASFLYDRISKDFQLASKEVSIQLKEVSNFTEIGHARKNKYRKLDQELLGGVEFRINSLKEHVDFATNWLSQYLALRNLSVTYFLALIAGIATIVSVLLSFRRP